MALEVPQQQNQKYDDGKHEPAKAAACFSSAACGRIHHISSKHNFWVENSLQINLKQSLQKKDY